ncbi:Nitric oxide synthase oxygenase [Kibdelosporangium sp. 4NS15]|uniref:Nitric oxide synthase oxygenase n=1 Tax=Kibdelosporangium persicum TaxID=2698649 RepID=A0ABX2EYX5_9PSEU|nr:nitric oxide synthase oxygenase [Kibdelosporangium persicum]NRN63917.1 Nitric oxide synthase oxygenase [Kibdelosporangium persicum]
MTALLSAEMVAAEEFLHRFHGARPRAGHVQIRLNKVRAQILATGTYEHTRAELAYGARIALRDSSVYTDGVPWRELLVRDLRAARTTNQVATACVQHLRLAAGNGRVRPTVTIFAPNGPRVVNEQLIRYAGYAQHGQVLGDRRHVAFTETVRKMGWCPPTTRSAFDLLPLVVQDEEQGTRLFGLPRDVVREIPLEHPGLDWFAGLGLRWHAIGACSRRLSIGGVRYPVVFNGISTSSAIGAEALGDDRAYGFGRVIADRLGLDTSADESVWRERAVLELDRAVLHSFRAAGVTIASRDARPARRESGRYPPSFLG